MRLLTNSEVDINYIWLEAYPIVQNSYPILSKYNQMNPPDSDLSQQNQRQIFKFCFVSTCCLLGCDVYYLL